MPADRRDPAHDLVAHLLDRRLAPRVAAAPPAAAAATRAFEPGDRDRLVDADPGRTIAPPLSRARLRVGIEAGDGRGREQPGNALLGFLLGRPPALGEIGII